MRFATVALVLFAGCRHGERAVGVTGGSPNEVFVSADQIARMKISTAIVDLEDVDDTVVTTGRIAYDDQKVVHVFTPVSGKAIEVPAQLGDHVKRGDVLAVIESPEIGVATSDASKARTELATAKDDFRRQKELLDNHAVSQRDFEVAADNYRKAKAERARADQKARLFRQGDVTGQTYPLRSALDGEVFMKAVSPGMELAGQYSGGTPLELFTVGRADTVWVLSDVFDLDVRRVKLGARVRVNLTSWPDRVFDGKVDWISAALDPSTHATRVRCTFDNPDGALKPDMFAKVTISVDVRRALAIARSAVLRLGEQTVVFVDRGRGRGTEEDKERFERMPVTVDERESSPWLIVDRGLEKGDRVVTGGAILLSSML
jgi:cobalt-zinc-cadmium efflux system membrane fusion protein